MPPGRLWLIPTPLGADSDPHRVLPADTLAAIEPLDYFVVENAKTARAFLKAVGTRAPLQALELRELSGARRRRRFPNCSRRSSRGATAACCRRPGFRDADPAPRWSAPPMQQASRSAR